MNKILHSIFSNADLYINNHQIYNSNRLYAQKTYFSNSFKSTLTDYKRSCIVKNMTMKKIQRITSKVHFLLEEWNCTVDLRVSCSTVSSVLLHPNMKVRIRLIRARPCFCMISENPNVSLGNVDRSLYTRWLMLKWDYHKKRMSQQAYAPVEYNYMETLAKTYHSCTTDPIHSGKYIQQRTYTSNSHCNEFKLCLYWLLCRESILVSTVYSEKY